jgi:flagellar protein FliL
MKAVTGIFSNIFGKVGPIFKTIGGVVQSVMLISVFAMNVLMGYIMFAPDDFPKPFYLSYAGQGTTTVIMAPNTANLAEPTAKAGTNSTKKATEVPAEPGNGKILDTGSKIVNLADPGGRRYLRATVALEVMPPEEILAIMHATPKAGAAEGAAAVDPLLTEYNDALNLKMPIINDVITTALSSKTFDSIYTTEGKDKLREEIMTQLNERLPDLTVISVYFTEFVVQ